MAVPHQYRTFWRRWWAALVDVLVFAPAMAFDYWLWRQDVPLVARICWFILWSFASPAYSIVLHARYGRTVGKLLLGVRVVSLGGSALSWRQAVLRDVLNFPFYALSLSVGLNRILNGLIPYDDPSGPNITAYDIASFSLLMLELVSALTNEKRRALHDYIAGSVVVREKYAHVAVVG